MNDPIPNTNSPDISFKENVTKSDGSSSSTSYWPTKTETVSVPTILKSIYLAYNKNINSKTKSLCFIGCGSAILDKSFHENFQRKFKIKVYANPANRKD